MQCNVLWFQWHNSWNTFYDSERTVSCSYVGIGCTSSMKEDVYISIIEETDFGVKCHAELSYCRRQTWLNTAM